MVLNQIFDFKVFLEQILVKAAVDNKFQLWLLVPHYTQISLILRPCREK